MKLKDKKFTTVKVKGGKEYVEVKERLQYLSKEFEGEYSINTDYQFIEAHKLWVVKATLSLTQNGVTCTYTGLGQEKEGGAGVNATSALENAETSAVGRACAMAGIGIDISIASADEVIKATNREAQQQSPTAETEKQDNRLEKNLNQHIDNTSTPEQIELAVAKQKEQIIKLLNNPVIQPKEKTDMLLKINELSKERADQAITKLKKTIADRETAEYGSPLLQQPATT